MANEPPKLLRNNFGGSVGGPLIKDRFFFFVNYEGHRQREAQSVVRVVPSAAMQDGIIQYQCETIPPPARVVPCKAWRRSTTFSPDFSV